MGTLLTGCGEESGPTGETVSGLAADAIDTEIGHHTRLVEEFTEDPIVNPCTGELTFTARFRFHGVLLPSGAFTVIRDLDRVECKA